MAGMGIFISTVKLLGDQDVVVGLNEGWIQFPGRGVRCVPYLPSTYKNTCDSDSLCKEAMLVYKVARFSTKQTLQVRAYLHTAFRSMLAMPLLPLSPHSRNLCVFEFAFSNSASLFFFVVHFHLWIVNGISICWTNGGRFRGARAWKNTKTENFL
jgi:hypothetical protein